MSMIWPTELNISGQRWTVTVLDDPSEVDVFRNAGLWGQCVPSKREIRVLKSAPDQMLTTLLHEMTHAVRDHVLGIHADDGEERLVTAFASVLADTLVRNGLAKLPGE